MPGRPLWKARPFRILQTFWNGLFLLLFTALYSQLFIARRPGNKDPSEGTATFSGASGGPVDGGKAGVCAVGLLDQSTETYNFVVDALLLVNRIQSVTTLD